jgi:hypothetical protein
MENSSNMYQNGKLFKVVNSDFSDCWVGGTVQPLSAKMADFRRHFKNEPHRLGKRLHQFLETYGVQNCSIVLIQECPCSSLEELFAKKCEYVESNECYNKVPIPRTPESILREKLRRMEHYENNKEDILEKNRLRNNERVKCPQCGEIRTKGKLNRQMKTTKCLTQLFKNNETTKEYVG